MIREEPCAPIALPPALAGPLAGYRWARDLVGESGGATFRLHAKSGAPDLFLKMGQRQAAADVTDEMVRLRWLAGRLPVPAVVHFWSSAEEAWLVTTALRGQTAYQLLTGDPAESSAIVDALADFIRHIHAIPVADCPFMADHGFRLARARERLESGLVPLDHFDEARAGWSAERVWDAAIGLLPLAFDMVVTHGDFSLDNILFADGAVTGCIDVGRVGLADPYQDLAILWHSLGEFGSGLQDRLFASYGITVPDRDRIDFHLMLDEFF
ncbi:APH(3')-I family aminoglycoside O-phosphotransferase [Sphingomonas sp. BIUV-7]|uniref:Aminoglycoside 3'-phosphotransferase n=1 Tax=Sphingomonas natans TaxID=3063330 RepID=A0ABT8YCR0_9SPHN|nr:APH(3')-I family aminoglycoside O-phosphotransferase [Sphingomonas sp. BIUV-7]MDO6415737.1 APH(3')-I family aminoglycoside O-phosphotransferase [Sphingomonas sp. BIUV-7]